MGRSPLINGPLRFDKLIAFDGNARPTGHEDSEAVWMFCATHVLLDYKWGNKFRDLATFSQLRVFLRGARRRRRRRFWSDFVDEKPSRRTMNSQFVGGGGGSVERGAIFLGRCVFNRMKRN